MPDINHQNGWNEWSKHILKELERLNACYEKLDERVQNLDKRLTIIEVKAMMLGGLAGVCVVLADLVVKHIQGP